MGTPVVLCGRIEYDTTARTTREDGVIFAPLLSGWCSAHIDISSAPEFSL